MSTTDKEHVEPVAAPAADPAPEVDDEEYEDDDEEYEEDAEDAEADGPEHNDAEDDDDEYDVEDDEEYGEEYDDEEDDEGDDDEDPNAAGRAMLAQLVSGEDVETDEEDGDVEATIPNKRKTQSGDAGPPKKRLEVQNGVAAEDEDAEGAEEEEDGEGEEEPEPEAVEAA